MIHLRKLQVSIRTLILLLILLCFCPSGVTGLVAQSITVEQAREEIRKRGLNEEEVLTELEKKGVNLATINRSSPTEMARAEKAIREVIAELEAKKSSSGTQIDSTQIPIESLNKEEAKEAAKNSEEVIEAIEEGATLEEAVSETLQENAAEKLKPINIYGHQLFSDQQIKKFRTVKSAKPRGDYILGPGDKISINIWGISEYTANFEINEQGFIKPEFIKRVYLKGLTINQAKEKLKSSFGTSYRFNDETFEVTLSTARTMSINIVGEVQNPGSFTVSALNTAINALFFAGGPNAIGSVRNIEIIGDGEVAELDIYEFLKNPSSEKKYYLQDGFYINVKPYSKIVNLEGAVKRPLRYELKENEGLRDLIEFAGGFTERALKNNIQIERITDEGEVLIDVDYKQGNVTLKSGDQVIVKAVPENLENIVSIEGAVLSPGRYALTEGMRISDLVNKTKLKDQAILSSVFLQRKKENRVGVVYYDLNLEEALSNDSSEENIVLRPGDKLIIKAVNEYVDASFISIEGQIRNPGEFSFDEIGSLSVSDIIYLSGGVTDQATDFGFIYRKNQENPNGTEYLVIQVKEAMTSPDGQEDVLLRAGDRVVIPSKANYQDKYEVTIDGAVRNPNIFVYDPSLSLSDAILLSGGLRQEANPNRIEIFRVDLSSEENTEILAATLKIDENYQVIGGDEFKLQPFDKIFIRSKADYELQKIVTINGEVKYPGKYPLVGENEKIASLIKRAGGLTSESFIEGVKLTRSQDGVGDVIFDLEKALENTSSSNNIILKEGDQVIIPSKKDLVLITGATKAYELYPDDIINDGKFAVPYEEGKSAKYYINKYAGGIAEDGDPGKVSVIYATGEMQKTSRFLGVFARRYPDVKPGTEIRVGYKDREPNSQIIDQEESKVDWGQTLADSVAQATAILSLVLLLQRID